MNITQMRLGFNTLLHSWGGDTPQEAVWAANEIMAGILSIKIKDLQYTILENEEAEEADFSEEDYETMYANFYSQFYKHENNTSK